MIYLVLILNSIITYFAIYIYDKFKRGKNPNSRMSNKDILILVLLSNAILIALMYIIYKFFPHHCFNDLFDPQHHTFNISSNQRYIQEIGESVFSGEPPF